MAKTFWGVALDHIHTLTDQLLGPARGRLNLTSERTTAESEVRGAVALLLGQLEEMDLGSESQETIRQIANSLRGLASGAEQILGGQLQDRLEDFARRFQLKYAKPIIVPQPTVTAS